MFSEEYYYQFADAFTDEFITEFNSTTDIEEQYQMADYVATVYLCTRCSMVQWSARVDNYSWHNQEVAQFHYDAFPQFDYDYISF